MSTAIMKMNTSAVLNCFYFFISTSVLLSVCVADPLDNWTLLHPNLIAQGCTKVAYGNGLYVAVGDLGKIIYSPNGVNWASANSGTFNTLHNVRFCGGFFVAVGDYGEIVYSQNGILWDSAYTPTFNALYDFAYGNGTFVAVGENSQILRSTNGLAWTEVISGSGSFTHVVYGNQLFVVAGDGGVIFTSPEGLNWTRRNSSLGSPSGFYEMVFTDGKFIASAHDYFVSSYPCVLQSTNGIDWNSQSVSLSLGAVTFYSSYYIAASDSGIQISTNGWLWTVLTNVGQYLSGIACGPSGIVSIGDGVLLTSVDGQSWVSRVSTSHSIREIVYNGSAWVAVAVNVYGPALGSIYTSTNSLDWVNTLAVAPYLWHVVYGNGKFLVLGNNIALSSVDGYNWVSNNFPSNVTVYSIIFANGRFVAVAEGGNAIVSQDGSNWITRTIAANTFTQITFGNGLYVAAGNSGKIYTSTDTVTWTQRVSGTTCTINGMAYGSGQFIAGLYSYDTPGFITSREGFDWTYQPVLNLGSHLYIDGMTYGSGIFLALGESDSVQKLFTSTDGINWSTRPVILPSSIESVAFLGNAFYAVGQNGTIMQSYPPVSGTPAFVRQPQSLTIQAGSYAVLDAAVNGASPMYFQWYKNGSPVSGATSSTLMLLNLSTNDSGQYRLLASNSVSSVFSESSTLLVFQPEPPGLAVQSYTGLSVTGIVGRAYGIEYTPNMLNTNIWYSATNFILTVNPQVWIDYDSVRSPRRFYRAVLLP